MANPEHLKILKQGVEVWNKWREENPGVEPDLSGRDLGEIVLTRANLSNANLMNSDLESSDLSYSNLDKACMISARLYNVNLDFAHAVKANFNLADLAEANIRNANLYRAELAWADLREVDFSESLLDEAVLHKANLEQASFENAKLNNAILEQSILIKTNFSNSEITGSRIYGISAWDIKKDGLIQKDLIITPYGDPEITVDDLEVAQFIYLMLNNQKIRDVIETITSKAVLILGRFTEERKAVLDALKDELRRRNYLPIVFDFENAGSKSLNETMSLLARMSRFIVADITDAKAVREELALVIPQNPSVPVIPLVLKGQEVYSTFDFPKLYRAVLPLHEYDSPEILLENIIPAIIAPAEQKVAELRGK